MQSDIFAGPADGLRIAGLSIRDVMRISVVELAPDGQSVIIGGRNAQGKTSLLQAIAMALGGGRQTPQRPIREGADTGEVVVSLTDGTRVRLRLTRGKNNVVVEQSGSVRRSPQAFLDSLVGPLSFDPVDFVRLKPDVQAKRLQEMAGVDTSGVDADIDRLYRERRDARRDAASERARVGTTYPHDIGDRPTMADADLRSRYTAAVEAVAEVRRLDAAVRGLGSSTPEPPDAVRVDMEALIGEEADASMAADDASRAMSELHRLRAIASSCAAEVERVRAMLADAEARLAAAELRVQEMSGSEQNLASASARLDKIRAKISEARAANRRADAHDDWLAMQRTREDTAEAMSRALVEAEAAGAPSDWQARIDEAAEYRRKADENERWQRESARVSSMNAAADAIDARLQDARARRAEMIAGANLPVDGLAWSADGVTLRGVPFAQVSQSEQLRACVAMACAANPALRVVFVRGGEVLDAESMAALMGAAADSGMQVWIERRSIGDEWEPTIVLEDGEVAR